MKFLGDPQGTTMSIQFIGNTSFPAITVCLQPDIEDEYNATFLDDCGIKM